MCLKEVNTTIFLIFIFQVFANHWMIQNVRGKTTFYNVIPRRRAIWKEVQSLRWDDAIFFLKLFKRMLLLQCAVMYFLV